MRFVGVVSSGLVAWSFLANLGLGDRLYVPRNLVATAGLVGCARRIGLDHVDLGADPAYLGSGLRWGGVSAVAVAGTIATGVALADVVEPVERLLTDDRAALDTGPLLAAVLVRIPIGTAVFEEVAFRGVLRAVSRRALRPTVATAWSSVVFGLWHIAPTAVALRRNDLVPLSRTGMATIAGAVVGTTAAGVLLDVLRARSGSLVAPVLAHWAANAVGLLAAARTR